MKRRVIIAMGVLVLISLSAYVVRWASHPVSTTASSTKQLSEAVLGSSNSLAPFTSTYFTTQVPADMQPKTSHENPNSPILASYLLTNVKPSLSDQAAITVGNMGLNSLSETSGVKQRANNPEEYQATSVENAPPGAISFRRVEGYEMAIFWKQGSKYVALVVSGAPQRQAELDQTLQTILTNWTWR